MTLAGTPEPRCSRRLGYDHVSSEVYDRHRLSGDMRRELVHRLTATTATATATLSYDRHLYYVNFTAEGGERPVYINVVRDPVERFISSFYYRRSRERLARISAHGHLTASPSINWLNRTVEQCVESGDPECSFSLGTSRRCCSPTSVVTRRLAGEC
ncbi:Uronyl 2-sulfotransferase [Chionoecetes opilio]|uniref:Uronyl 2-sulfotransferase n=1 Tax=Chionoecetes opilio TaxID=41210 RepID=A0A8J8WBZ4_CHIOP|nr:Uronyl 2-sulfotransferase [Chionoecetes opilio]